MMCEYFNHIRTIDLSITLTDPEVAAKRSNQQDKVVVWSFSWSHFVFYRLLLVQGDIGTIYDQDHPHQEVPLCYVRPEDCSQEETHGQMF